MNLRERNGWWEIKISRPRGQGRALWRALGTKDKAEAELRAKLGKFDQMERIAKADVMTREAWVRLTAGRNVKLKEAVDAYLVSMDLRGKAPSTIATHSRRFDGFIRHCGLGGAFVHTVEAKHIDQYVNRDKFVTLATRSKEMNLLSIFFQWCVDKQYIPENPTRDVGVKVHELSSEQLIPVPIAPIADADVFKLLERTQGQNYGMILLGYHFGLRLSTCSTLQWIDFPKGERLHVYTKKGRQIVNEALPPEVKTWFDGLPPNGSDYIFPSAAAYIETGATNAVSTGFKRLFERHGIKGKSFHSLRKTSAVNKWQEDFKTLGDDGQRALMSVALKRGMENTQKMLGHAAGSSVTEKHYLRTLD